MKVKVESENENEDDDDGEDKDENEDENGKNIVYNSRRVNTRKCQLIRIKRKTIRRTNRASMTSRLRGLVAGGRKEVL